jgi:starch synthase
MKSLFLTNEYPPNIYGGAGVHVEYLSQALSKFMEVEVRCFGDQHVDGPKYLSIRGFGLKDAEFKCPKQLRSVFGALQRCLDFNTAGVVADVVHCHTWYSHFGGILARFNYGLPLVITVHSLEPLRPWKREQLGRGYDFTIWLEKTALETSDAIIAVSAETKKDILRLFDVPDRRVHVIHNGIDLEEYQPVQDADLLKPYGIDVNQPYILFIGRIARQKGILHLISSIHYFMPGFQVVLCASAPDTAEIEREVTKAIQDAQAQRPGIIWIHEMLNVAVKVQLYSHASVFVCPSIYEPFGIINLEAMACEVPVVASAVGGIKEVVVDGETGFLIPLEKQDESTLEPVNAEQFERHLATRINELVADKHLQGRMGKAGRRRAEQLFGWDAIARQTCDLYKNIVHVR